MAYKLELNYKHGVTMIIFCALCILGVLKYKNKCKKVAKFI